jgi:aspartate aminotransferase
MIKEFEARRDLVCAGLNKIPGIRCFVPDGAFYAFFDVTGTFGKTVAGGPFHTDTDFCKAALDHALVCLVQGSAFGAPGHARLSFAASRAQLEEGLLSPFSVRIFVTLRICGASLGRSSSK